MRQHRTEDGAIYIEYLFWLPIMILTSLGLMLAGLKAAEERLADRAAGIAAREAVKHLQACEKHMGDPPGTIEYRPMNERMQRIWDSAATPLLARADLRSVMTGLSDEDVLTAVGGQIKSEDDLKRKKYFAKLYVQAALAVSFEGYEARHNVVEPGTTLSAKVSYLAPCDMPVARDLFCFTIAQLNGDPGATDLPAHAALRQAQRDGDTTTIRLASEQLEREQKALRDMNPRFRHFKRFVPHPERMNAFDPDKRFMVIHAVTQVPFGPIPHHCTEW